MVEDEEGEEDVEEVEPLVGEEGGDEDEEADAGEDVDEGDDEVEGELGIDNYGSTLANWSGMIWMQKTQKRKSTTAM